MWVERPSGGVLIEGREMLSGGVEGVGVTLDLKGDGRGRGDDSTGY